MKQKIYITPETCDEILKKQFLIFVVTLIIYTLCKLPLVW